MTMPSAESAVLAILSHSECQYVNDRTLSNPQLEGHTSSNPGRAIGEQSLYYKQLSESLRGQNESSPVQLHIVKPSI
jgi:hypothetical protein